MDTTLFGALIAGVSGLIGTGVGAGITFWNAHAERKEKRREFLRTRLEELADLNSKSIEWNVRVSGCRTLEELRGLCFPASSRKMWLLSALYFPGVKQAAIDYHNELIHFYGQAIDSLGSGALTVGEEMARAGTSDGISARLALGRQRIDDAISAESEKANR